MSVEDLGKRVRAPPGYYSCLQGGKLHMEESKIKMADSKSGKPKITRSRGSRGSKKSLASEEDKMAEMDRRSEELGKELEALETQDGYSKHLHVLAKKGQIEFIEDIEVPADIEKEEVWQKANEDHAKEGEVIKVRMERLRRKKELCEIKHKLREQRLVLLQEEKQLELQEKQRQIQLGAHWLQMEKAEHDMQMKWDQQQRDMEEFEKSKRLSGWVHDAAVHVSRGDVASVRSKEIKGVPSASVQRLTKGSQMGTGKSDKKAMIVESKLMQNSNNLRSEAMTGVHHLNRLGLLPNYGIQEERDPSVTQLPTQDKGCGLGARPKEVHGRDLWEHLSLAEERGKDVNAPMHGLGLNVDAPGEKSDKVKVKSGKFAKSHQELQREESWPHLNVLRQYARRTTFDQMDFDVFVAGESRIILAMMHRNQARAVGRLKVLCKVGHWLCKCKDWSAVRTIYEAIIESVEMGDADWMSNFDVYESLLPPSPSVLANIKKIQEEQMQKEKERESKKRETENKKTEVFWCKEFQKGSCAEAGPHMAQLKPEDKPVWVAHICAMCWQKDRAKRSHPESDASCPNKKP